MSSTAEIRVPDIGEFEQVEVIEVLVAPGDRIEIEQSLMTLESDKATMEIPASQAGVVVEVLVSVGDAVSQGDLIVRLSDTDSAEARPVATGAPADVPNEPAATAQVPSELAAQAPGFPDWIARQQWLRSVLQKRCCPGYPRLHRSLRWWQSLLVADR